MMRMSSFKIAIANALTNQFKGMLGHNPYISSLATQDNEHVTQDYQWLLIVASILIVNA